MHQGFAVTKEQEFRLLVAERYERAAEQGSDMAQEMIDWIRAEAPVPRPWWLPSITISLLRITHGAAPTDPTPEAFRRFEIFEAEKCRYWQAVAWRHWIPFGSDDLRFELQLNCFNLLMRTNIEYVAEHSDLDDEIAVLLAGGLSRALAANPAYRPPGDPLGGLGKLVARLTSERCLPTPDRVQEASRTLQKVVAYWKDNFPSSLP